MIPAVHDITGLLTAWSAGDQQAFDRLVPIVYDELRRIARSYMERESAGHPLQATALVHEAYIRLIDANRVQWQNRAHFYAVSANLMRRTWWRWTRLWMLWPLSTPAKAAWSNCGFSAD